MRLKRSLSALVILIYANLVFAQTTTNIKGAVVDPKGAKVAGAIITLYSRDNRLLITTSDANGSYRFDGVSPGEYVVTVDAQGFSRNARALRAQSNGDTVDFNLELAAINSEVVVTAEGTPQTIDETSKAISVINADQIERRNENSLVDALRLTPGVRVEQLGGPGGFSKILIRGLRVVDTSILLDGLRVRDAADFRGGLNPFMEDILVNNFDRVEVLRGSGSSLYGSNAVGGVVNIVSLEGAGAPKFNLGFEGGSLGLFRERFQVSGGVGQRFGYSFSATRLDVNHGVHDGEIYRNTSLGGHARYAFNPKISLRGTISYTRGFSRVDDSPFPIGPDSNPFGFGIGTGPVVGFLENDPDPDNFRKAYLFVGSLTFLHQVNSVYSYSAAFQSVATSKRFDSGPDQSETAKRLGLFADVSVFQNTGRIQTFNFINTIRVDRHNLITAGVEGEYEKFSQIFTSPFFSTPQTTDRQRSLAFFAQDQLTFLDGRLQFSAAFRTQGFTIKNPESVPEVQNIDVKRAMTGDGSIAYLFPQSNTKLRAHVGNSFRAPSLSERFVTFRGQRIGNPFLRPERGLSVDGGIDQTAWNNQLRASATYFYSKLQEVIVSTAFMRETNAPGALARGVELSLAVSPHNWIDVVADYTFTNSTQVQATPILRADNVRLPAGANIQALSIPRHMFGLEVNKSFENGLNINFNLHSVSEHNFPLFDPVFFSQVLFPFEGHTKADLNVSYLKRLTESRAMRFYGKFGNIFGSDYVEEGFRAPGRTGLAGIVFTF
ncbi:MAG TPA: TonB-dependent receptor [Pyrinomonadaceae bacterium]|nr:TonB-dependent receptor [Pyrinomonadaceae bacterium]